MTSLAQINEQITKSEAQVVELRKQAEALRSEAKQGVIAEVMAKIAEFGLSAADLRLASSAKGGQAARSSKSKEKAPPRYRSPSGETWSGGRGRKPGWITAALAEGKDLSEFEIR